MIDTLNPEASIPRALNGDAGKGRCNIMRGLFCLLFAASLALMSGCDEDTAPLDQSLKQPLEVVSVAPPGGWISLNSTVTVTFNNAMELVRIYILDPSPPTHPCSTLTGVTVFTGGKTATWCVGGEWGVPVPQIEIALMVSGTDIFGQELEGYEPISFTVASPDHMLPYIVGNECDPEDGEAGVDPEKYSEELVIVFTELMSNVEVVATHPEFPFTGELNEAAFTISFLDGYTMPYDTKFSIELSGADLSGESVMGYDIEKCEPKPPEYSFTTKAEGQ